MRLREVEQLGKMIRAARKKKGLTQEDIAAVSGTGIRYIRELEYGKQSCHMGKALYVAHLLGIRITIDGDI